MTSAADAWAALRGRPDRFLVSAWPWRAVVYLVSTVPLGVATALALALALLLGVVTLVVVVGVAVLAGIPVLAGLLGAVERRRLGLVLPAPTSGTSLRERLSAGRRVPVSWPEVGYAFLLGAVLWLVDLAALLLLLTVPVALLLAPVLQHTGEMVILEWTIDEPWESALACGAGLLTLVVAAYTLTALAVAQAALARLLLDPKEAALAAAVVDLKRSRVDLVDAFETERRRIERDLHDGVQQRLVALTMTLGQAELEVPEGEGLALLRRAHREAEIALEELRGTVRGIHPRVLVDHGLAAAVHELADRSPVPVDVDVAVPRVAAPVEAAAYFVVSEALTNVVRHADARHVQVHAWVRPADPGGPDQPDELVLTVVDDGAGGARSTPGSGLAGLRLRLDALGGTLHVHSPPGGPTEVRMECPCDPAA